MFAKTFGCCRFVYNWALNLKIEAYKDDKKSLGNVYLTNLLKSELKAQHEWLSEVNSQSLQSALRNLDRISSATPKQWDFPGSRAARAVRVSNVRNIAGSSNYPGPLIITIREIYNH